MVSTKTESHPKLFTSVIGETVRINKYVIFGLNSVFTLIYVIRNFAISGIVTYLIATLLMFLVAFKSSEDIPAVADLPIIILADIIIYLGVRFRELKSMVDIDNLTSYFSDVDPVFWILFWTGIAVGIVGIVNIQFSWLTGFAGGLIGVSIILMGWSNCNIKNLKFINDGKALLILFVLGNILWTVFLYLIVKTVPSRATSIILIEIILLVIVIAGLTVGNDYIKECLPVWKVIILKLPNTVFAWWKVILSSVVILAGIFMLYLIEGDGGNGLSVDTYALVIIGELILTAKLLMSNYFTYNWLIPILLLLGTLRCMNNDYTSRKTLRLSSIAYLSVQNCVAILMIFLFKKGLWMNVCLSIVFFTVFYVKHSKIRKANHNNSFWVMILLCIVGQTAAWVWRNNFAKDLMILLAVVLGSGILTIIAINLKQPGGRTAPNNLRIIVCVCVTVICLMVLIQNTTKIHSRTDRASETVTIILDAKGKNNSISSAYYYWRDSTGRIMTKEIIIPSNKYKIAIKEEILTIVSKDSYGFVTSKILWYPFWWHSIFK